MRTTEDSTPPSSLSPPRSRSPRPRPPPRCPPRPPPPPPPPPWRWPPPSRPPRRGARVSGASPEGAWLAGAWAAGAAAAGCWGAGVSVGCCCCSSAISVPDVGCASTHHLEFQSCLAGRVGQSLHATVIHAAAAIESHGTDTGRFATLGDGFPGRFGGGDVGAVLERAANFGAGGGDGGQRAAGHVVDQLCVNVLAAAIDRQPRALLRAKNIRAHAEFATIQALLFFCVFVCHVCLDVGVAAARARSYQSGKYPVYFVAVPVTALPGLIFTYSPS